MNTSHISAADGALNMAVDSALLERVQRDRRPVLRFYRWDPACLSFGRNQPARELYDETVAHDLGIDIVRRPTGGMAVLHAQEITYSVAAPFAFLGGPRETYLAINRALVAGLRRVGVDAHLAEGARRSPFGTMHPCFAEPAAGEVVANGKKLVGSAQRCERRTLLQHGSILVGGSQDDVGRIAKVPFLLEGRATSLQELLPEVPDDDTIVSALSEGFEQECGLTYDTDASGVSERAIELAALYRSPEWTWRR